MFRGGEEWRRARELRVSTRGYIEGWTWNLSQVNWELRTWHRWWAIKNVGSMLWGTEWGQRLDCTCWTEGAQKVGNGHQSKVLGWRLQVILVLTRSRGWPGDGSLRGYMADTCHRPHLWYRIRGVRTEVPALLDQLGSEVSDLGVLPHVGEAQEASLWDCDGPLCRAHHHLVHCGEHSLHGHGAPRHERCLRSHAPDRQHCECTGSLCPAVMGGKGALGGLAVCPRSLECWYSQLRAER